MKSPIVSFIIPMYNEADRIQRCIQSIQQQTLNNIEIIVVNDGSTDNSFKIVQDLANCDDRIHVLNFENGGTSFALNKGLEISKGAYIGFSGADDWIESDMLEQMVERMERDYSDVVICNIQKEWEGKIQSTISIPSHTVSDKELLKRFILFEFDYSICNKLYKRSYLQTNNIKFDLELRIGQDVLFNLYVFSIIEKVSLIPAAFYHYVAKEGSLMSSPQQKRIESFNRIIQEFKQFTDEQKLPESWEIFSRYIGLGYQSYFFNLLLKSQFTSSLSFQKYVRHLIDSFNMLHPLLIPAPKWCRSKTQKFKNLLLSKRRFKTFALLAAIRHKTIF